MKYLTFLVSLWAFLVLLLTSMEFIKNYGTTDYILMIWLTLVASGFFTLIIYLFNYFTL